MPTARYLSAYESFERRTMRVGRAACLCDPAEAKGAPCASVTVDRRDRNSSPDSWTIQIVKSDGLARRNRSAHTHTHTLRRVDHFAVVCWLQNRSLCPCQSQSQWRKLSSLDFTVFIVFLLGFLCVGLDFSELSLLTLCLGRVRGCGPKKKLARPASYSGAMNENSGRVGGATSCLPSAASWYRK